MSEPIVRIAARGDGVTASGRHAALAAPGDLLHEDATLTPGPMHQAPPCRHFPQCGGCQLQHVADAAYRLYLRDRVASALAQHGLETEVREPHLSPPNSRRRATLRAMRLRKGVAIGFNEERSHRIVDIRECHILRPELFALVAPLRRLLGELAGGDRISEVRLTLCDQGVDLALSKVAVKSLAAAEALTGFAERHRLARLSLDEGFGAEIRYEPVPATVTLSGVPVPLPPGAFLQATEDGEAALVEAVREGTGGARRVADLFAGLGTFALSLGQLVYAAEAWQAAVVALRAARPDMATEHRDLYRRPLSADELGRFEAVVLDPPRAGAAEQVRELAGSAVPRVAYVSCNPATFARDARTLVDGGFRLNWVQPVGQFRWSTHVELAAAFAR
ncbi:MAG: 23S rRNA (uracil(1939)-C(5))-methyltransferase [uncultured Sphingomonas sp.]|uniref:23S rRNA (Uracil(1939)-C(5))-methyltransferase n=1 Tax=uncultured Sphingomonas sp. TaxID=158754 RepID=A0A6J4SP06_9SPHN|nr:class I SAM-dependent RNA methyltransferase [uncultured Sphingomonas sp.]CAA9499226.1 MAG: 23S rRNA (uracil(1939)-C(5))-methyltransferase [uncultured Sphingomonas sp.]